ncbi:hypothetical protein Misp01_66500 [Microtetraspora sp. NBRC 13810]|uniref:hypothetical protein n=1 Tax=Microtetraspora sp. NBRC 13810 TaxID=3030990 RepID=UPI0024A24508|nr:hypothetical protein [Microtetraspora sp. NBRC 13810]GLW11522.1 hypothetical protein Misp01_66500 [Microtetraspora sp. NBRC 13810]
MNHTLGDFAGVSANLVRGREEVRLADEGITIPVTAADQVCVTGTLRGGAAVSVFYRGAFSRGDNLRWEINGTEGDLILTSEGINGNLQVADLTLHGGRGASICSAAASRRGSCSVASSSIWWKPSCVTGASRAA